MEIGWCGFLSEAVSVSSCVKVAALLPALSEPSAPASAKIAEDRIPAVGGRQLSSLQRRINLSEINKQQLTRLTLGKLKVDKELW